MSTRSTINFGYDEPDDQNGPTAKVYRHSDGYPDAVLPDLAEFFRAVREQCEGTMFGTRFNDPSYLAAKYVVWQARQNTRYGQQIENEDGERVYGFNLEPDDPRLDPLAFGNLGIITEDPGDIEHTYWIDCSSGSDGGVGDFTLTVPNVYHSPTRINVGGPVDIRGWERVSLPDPDMAS